MKFGKIRRFFRKIKKKWRSIKTKFKGLRRFFQHVWVAAILGFIRRPYTKMLVAVAIIAAVVLVFEIYAYIQELKEVDEFVRP